MARVRLRARLATSRLALDVAVLGAGLVLYELNNHVLKRLGLPGLAGVFVAGHLNDVVAGMAFLAYTNLLFDVVYPQVRLRRLPAVAGYALACGLFWEYVAPVLLRPSVSDPWDVLCYVAGSLAYWLANALLERGQRAARA